MFSQASNSKLPRVLKTITNYSNDQKVKTNQDKVPVTIADHYYNYLISVVLPDFKDIPVNLDRAIVEDTDYYKIIELPVHELINQEFIEAFVKKGELTLLSSEKNLSTENCISVTPTGYLILSLLAADYQELGLEGSPTFFSRQPTRFIIKINLKEDSFVPGKNKYERVKKCLENNFKHKFDVILSWDPPEDKLCPSSVALWFNNHGYKTFLCHVKSSKRLNSSVNIPLASDDLFDWIKIFSTGNSDNSINTSSAIKSVTVIKDVLYIEYRGFFTRSRVIKILNTLKEFINSNNSTDVSDWGSLHVQGFDNSPVSWGLKEHAIIDNDGTNNYTIILKSNGDLSIQKCLSSNSRPKNK
ncbi:ribonuclease P protein subunit p40-like [Microplitis mediator]|uniref:ribonuclease P protein subunit p40-like n=1 Tax=Microplitis mediator TaxID=375433 RepID=UPI0025572AFF|nr:ribonuclease P protein subunit p40-like [Microplitis mediator]